jgi:predicted NBD/HSP70 family sugar kinase
MSAGTREPTLITVLDLIREHPSISRVELADLTGLTPTTITHAVRKLMTFGFVQEAGKLQAVRGGPRRLLELRPDACYMVGVQFDRWSAVGVIIDLGGQVMLRHELPAPGTRPPEDVVADFAAHVETMLQTAGVNRSDVLGIGLATYGPQDREGGTLLTPQPTEAWQGFSLTKTLADATGLPVVLENDATAAALGVQSLGGSSGSFAVVFMATGIGAEVVVDGQPYRGAASNGLELGHISLNIHGPVCTCGNRGCLDSYAGPRAVAENAERDPELARRLDLGHGPLADFLTVAEATLSGDADAEALINDSAGMLAAGIVTLVNLLDVNRVVLAGSAFATIGPFYRTVIQEVLENSVFMRHVHGVRTELANDTSHAAAIGGAIVVLRNMLEASAMRESRAPGGTASPAATR